LRHSEVKPQSLNNKQLSQVENKSPSNELEISEIECDIDEDVDGEHYQGKNINSFINKLRDISTFNPSGIKSKEKGNNSMMVIPASSIELKKQNRYANNSQLDPNILDPGNNDRGFSSVRDRAIQDREYNSPYSNQQHGFDINTFQNSIEIENRIGNSKFSLKPERIKTVSTPISMTISPRQ